MKKEPNFFVVGAAKAGTTALAGYLERHPQVYMSPIKEPNHFSQDIKLDEFELFYKSHHKRFKIKEYLASPVLEKRHIEFVPDRDDYLQLFRDAGDLKAVGEASTTYLYSEVAAAEIHQKIPNAKIIMILRDPVERAFSHYKMDRSGGVVSGTFREEFDKDISAKKKGWGITHLYRELGLYHDQVKRYLDLFPKEQIQIYLYEDWVADNQAVLDDLAAFLGISPFNVEQIVRNQIAVMPVSGRLLKFLRYSGLRSVLSRLLPSAFREQLKKGFYKKDTLWLCEDEKRQVYQFFKEDIDQLEKLIGKELCQWKQ